MASPMASFQAGKVTGTVCGMTSRKAIASPSPRATSEQSVLTAAKGGGITFAGSLFEYAVRFATGIVLARFLGSEQYGLYSLALTAAAIASGLALFGLPSALVRYVALFTGRQDEKALWGVLQLGIGLTTVVSIFSGIGLYLLANPIAETMFHEPKLVPLLRLISLIVPFLTLGITISAATRGFSKMQYTVIAQNILQPSMKLVLFVVVVVVTGGLNAAQALNLNIVVAIIVTVMLLFFLDNLFSLRRSLRTAVYDHKGMLKYSLPLYLSYLLQTFRSNVQTVLLGALNTVATVGIFTVASQINLIGNMFHQSIVTASMPIVSELFGGGKREQMGRFYQTMTKWTFTLNLPMLLIVLLFPVPILSIFGQDYVEGAVALTILAWANLVDAGTGICGVVLDMSGNTSLNLLNSILLFVSITGLNVLLIPQWGLIGAAVAGLAATSIINLLRLIEVFVLFRFLPYNLSFIKPIVAGIVALAFTWVLRQQFHTAANLVYAGLSAVMLFAVYLGVILLLGLSDEDRVILMHIRRRLGAVLVRQA
jgi:O-antigen/teichoic acid export membrane protein